MLMIGDPEIDRFQVGQARVTRIEEWRGTFLTPQVLFAGFSADAYADTREAIGFPYLDLATDAIHARLQSWVIEHGGQTVLIDTGAGNDKERPGLPIFGGLKTPFLKRLASAGFAVEDIDLVICTHLHVDHVGWNTQLVGGEWRPTFPRAEYVFPVADAVYWDPRNVDRFPPHVGAAVNAGFFEDSVQPILDAGRARLVEGVVEVGPGLRLDPVPGHTPGSTAITLQSDGEAAIFCGDVVHHPLQILNPTWNSIFCEDAALARESRRKVLDMAADHDACLVPAHFAGEHRVRVQRVGGGFSPVFGCA
jgi:glyoxylase-like metal-dependent hydrolase (beta-lactamase superfamily II)